MKSKSSTAMKSLMLMLLCAAMTWGGSCQQLILC